MRSPDAAADGPAPRWVRVRLVAAGVLSAVLSGVSSSAVLLAVCAASAAVLLLRVRSLAATGRTMLCRMAALAGFALLVWLTLPWGCSEGRPAVSQAGLALASVTSLRIGAIGLCSIALLTGLSGLDVGRALRDLGVPARITTLLLLTVRYVPLLGDTHRRIDRAMRARGFRPAANVRTMQVLAHQVGLVLAHAVWRAHRVHLAMRARGSAASAGRRPEC